MAPMLFQTGRGRGAVEVNKKASIFMSHMPVAGIVSPHSAHLPHPSLAPPFVS